MGFFYALGALLIGDAVLWLHTKDVNGADACGHPIGGRRLSALHPKGNNPLSHPRMLVLQEL